MRTVLIHYHTFKNAGTSVDNVLKSNFGDGWINVEGQNNRKFDRIEMTDFITSHPEITAISSHTAIIAPPELEGVRVIPIVFIRHPVLRIQSAYAFQRRQGGNSPAAIAAGSGNFSDYLDWVLARPVPWQMINFQASRLKDFHQNTQGRDVHLWRPRAMKALQDLPFVGSVEHFDLSMQRLKELIQPHFSEFEIFESRANINPDFKPDIHARLNDFRDEVGDTTYSKLFYLNSIDMELHKYVDATYAV